MKSSCNVHALTLGSDVVARSIGSCVMSRGYRTEKVTFGERFGMLVGGGAVLALLMFQVMFVARLAGF